MASGAVIAMSRYSGDLEYVGRRVRDAKAKPTSESIEAGYCGTLDFVISEMKLIEKMIPGESSRTAYTVKDENARLLIEARKNDLLSYIQTICRDVCVWAEKSLDEGREFRASQAKRKAGR